MSNNIDPTLMWQYVQQNMGGNYGTGIDPSLLQMILPNLGGASLKDANSYMTLVDKQGNYTSDLLKMMMDPSFATLFGTYVPQDTSQQLAAPTPTLDAWLAGSDGPIYQQIAQGMMNGTLSQGAAFALLKKTQGDKTDPASTALGMFDDNALMAQVKNGYDEVVNAQTVKSQQLANDPLRKAGLPGMNERYSDDLNGDGVPDNVPMGEQAMASYAKDMQHYQDQQRIAESRFAGQDVNPSFKGWNSVGATPGAPVAYKDAKQGDAPSVVPQSAHLDEAQMAEYMRGLDPTQRAGLDPIPVGIDEETYQSWKHSLPATVQGYYPDKYPSAQGAEAQYSVEAPPAEKKAPPRVGTDRSFDPSRPVAEVEKWKNMQANLDNEMMHAKRAYAAQLDAQGRTPLKDNLTQRMALIKMVLGG